MNPAEEAKYRQNKVIGEINQLAYTRYRLGKQLESCQKQIAEIDQAIMLKEELFAEYDRARRDFDTYLAIQEAAVTLDPIKDAITKGENLEVPPTAIKEN